MQQKDNIVTLLFREISLMLQRLGLRGNEQSLT